MQKRIVLDVDGVLADFNNSYADLLEAHGAPTIDRTPPWPLIWDWPAEVADQDIRDAAWAEVQQDPEFFIKLAPTPDALQLAASGALELLLERYDVYIVTSRPPRARGATEFWLGELFGSFIGAIHTGDLKGPLCKALGAVALIDDKPEHCESALAHGIEAHLVWAPYNQGRPLPFIVEQLLHESQEHEPKNTRDTPV